MHRSLAVDGELWHPVPFSRLGALLMPDEILTLAEVAQMLKVSASALVGAGADP